MSKVTSIRLDDELVARLDQLAASLDRPRAWLIEQAILRYVDEEARHIAAIGEALAEYQSGQSVLRPHAEVMERIAGKIRARAACEDPLA